MKLDNSAFFPERFLVDPAQRGRYEDYLNTVDHKGDTLHEQVASLINHFDFIIIYENSEERLNMIVCDTIKIVRNGGNEDEVNKHLSKYGGYMDIESIRSPKLKDMVSKDWEIQKPAQEKHRAIIAKKIFELIKLTQEQQD